MSQDSNMIALAAFLKKKGIHVAKFKKALPDLFARFETEFAGVSAESFDQRKKFWLNSLRMEFPLPKSAQDSGTKVAGKKATPRPIMKKPRPGKS